MLRLYCSSADWKGGMLLEISLGKGMPRGAHGCRRGHRLLLLLQMRLLQVEQLELLQRCQSTRPRRLPCLPWQVAGMSLGNHSCPRLLLLRRRR